jgi:hypothetical protein
MFPPRTTHMAATLPTAIKGYIVLPVTIPPSKALPKSLRKQTLHYLYLHQHEPKIPSPDDSRSLFVVNVPVTSTVPHFKALFERICAGAKLEDVEFTSTVPVLRQSEKPEVVGELKQLEAVRKRKYEETEELELPELPGVWDRELCKSGSNAVLRFVDIATCKAVLKALNRLSKQREASIIWGEGVDPNEVRPLGLKREFTPR